MLTLILALVGCLTPENFVQARLDALCKGLDECGGEVEGLDCDARRVDVFACDSWDAAAAEACRASLEESCGTSTEQCAALDDACEGDTGE